MKKWIITLVFAFVLGFSFTSCSKDDDFNAQTDCIVQVMDKIQSEKLYYQKQVGGDITYEIIPQLSIDYIESRTGLKFKKSGTEYETYLNGDYCKIYNTELGCSI